MSHTTNDINLVNIAQIINNHRSILNNNNVMIYDENIYHNNKLINM